MPPRPDAAEFERFVLRRQAAVHHVALRMLGDAAEAEDATQEAFLRAFERFDRLDPERDEVAWIHTVAVRVVLNRLRARRPRERAEAGRAAAAPGAGATEEAPVERREREETVAEHVGRLPPDERAAVVLEYYAGLPQTRVAEVLGVPRTTVQSRVARALAALRASLSGTGALAVAPLEDVLRGTPAPPVSDALTRALLHAASRAAASTTSVAPLLTLGGLAVTKPLVLAAAGAALVLLAGGYAVGRAFAGRGDGVPPEAGVSALEHARVLEENARLKQEAAGRLAAAPAGASSRRDPGTAAGASPAAAGMETAGAGDAVPAAGDAAAVDWGTFAKAWSGSIDVLLETRGEEKATPEQQKQVMGILVAFLDASTRAHALSTTPFFDARVLPGLVEAMYAAPLDLPADARAALDARVRAALEQVAPDVAAAQGRPAAMFEARQRVVDQVMETVRSAAPAERRERAAKMEETAAALLTGDHELAEVGVDPAKPQGFAERVAATWHRHLGLEDDQDGAVRPIAESFGREAIDAWRRHGLDREGAAVSPEERRAFEREVLRAQVAAERALDVVLTPAQRAKQRDMPRLLRPHLGGDVTTTTGGGGI